MSEPALPSWFMSSSPESSERDCQMLRFLGYHLNGTGIRRAGKSIPLTTGTMVHEALASIVKLKLSGPCDTVEEILGLLCKKYWEEVREAGFQGRDDDKVSAQERAQIQTIFDEQTTLLEGLVYGWLRTAAKDFYERYEVLAIEQEMPLEIPWAVEGSRLIRGSKQDLVVEDKRTGNAGVINWKTSADWRYLKHLPQQPQTMMECVAAEQTLGRPVRWFTIYGLIKGSRKNIKLPEDGPREFNGPEQQDSLLCYGFRMPPIPGLQQEDLKPCWNYIGEDGRKHTLGKRYSERPLITRHISSKEWVDRIPQGELNKLFIESGPHWVNPYAVEQYLRGLAGSEQRWVEQLHKAYEAEATLGGWESKEFQAALDGIFSRNYSKCDDLYYRPCPMRGLCRKEQGWKTLEGFQAREPHYEAEIALREQGE